jgi:hypothetical protein
MPGGMLTHLEPVRAYLRWREIPPTGIGAYGVVSFQALPTAETRARLLMVCEAFKAYLPKQSEVAGSVALKDQMLTIWPLDTPGAAPALSDDCAYVISHYDLQGGLLAIRDAQRQGARLHGAGPYLIGWSPSDTRGKPDKVVLIVDLSDHTSQDSINADFQYWRQEVIENPSLWKSGLHIQSIKDSVRDFFDKYGQIAINAYGMVVGKR